MPLRGAASQLCLMPRKVIEAIEEGRLLGVFDLSISGDKPLFRILPQALENFSNSIEGEPAWQEVFDLLAPESLGPNLTSTYLQFILNVTQATFDCLAARNEFTIVRPGRHGPGGAALISRASFESFLMRRRYPRRINDP